MRRRPLESFSRGTVEMQNEFVAIQISYGALCDLCKCAEAQLCEVSSGKLTTRARLIRSSCVFKRDG